VFPQVEPKTGFPAPVAGVGERPDFKSGRELPPEGVQ
jgi:hypothetical protein